MSGGELRRAGLRRAVSWGEMGPAAGRPALSHGQMQSAGALDVMVPA